MAHRIPEARAPQVPLRVLPRGTALVQDYRALVDAGTNRFHGWRWDGTAGPEFVDPTDKQTKRHGGRVKQTDQVVEIAADDPYRGEYLKHLQAGDLWAADEATAREAGVPFEPHFAGEHPKTSAGAGLDGAKLTAALKAGGFPEDAGVASVPWDTEFKPKVPDPAPAKAAAPASK